MLSGDVYRQRVRAIMSNSSQNTSTSPEGRSFPWWPLLAVFALAVPAALFGVDKYGSGLSRRSMILVLSASLAGYAVAVNTIIRDKLGEHRRQTRLLVWLAAVLLYLGSVVLLWFNRPTPPLHGMPGVRDVAVAGFSAKGQHQKQLLENVSADFARVATGRIPGVTAVHSYAGQAKLPLAELQDKDRSDLESETSDFADQTNAEIVLAGVADIEDSGRTTLTPAFYIRADQIADAPELAGWYLSDDPIPVEGGLATATGRGQLTDEMTRRLGRLSEFVKALEVWRHGKPADARRILSGLLDPKTQDGFVTSDLVHLFRGHAAEQQASGSLGLTRTQLLEAARDDYRAIPPDSPAAWRATLSLQGNAYRRANVGPCKPDTVNARDLANVSKTLRVLAENKDPSLTELGRLKARLNLAQVESCRLRAKLTKDDTAVTQVAEKLRSARKMTGITELLADAEAIASLHANWKGNNKAAIKHIETAIENGSNSFELARWQTLLATYHLEDCNPTAAVEARNDAVKNFARAEEGRGVDPKIREQWQKTFKSDLQNPPGACRKQ
ncbi:hypothetical protein AB0O22_17525 [Streptomyces sp. NPDC091204]|uniref:hypothetical protein n=1 Tax=Streptomyces sp. NPDC091204 TaxID=3155299 RepID=UPI003424B389